VPDGDTAAPAGAAATTRPANWLGQAVPLAVDVGWTMAVLYEKIGSPAAVPGAPPAQLPTVNELDDSERCQVETVRLRCLLGQISGVVGTLKEPIPTGETLKGATGTKEALRTLLINVNRQILEGFACADRELIVGYQIGRALRDTACPPAESVPDDEAQVLRTFARRRISRIQEWIKSISGSLPGEAGAIVSDSLGRWSDFVGFTLDKSGAGRMLAIRDVKFQDFAGEIKRYLLAQGDTWLGLLTGSESSQIVLTPEGRVAAAEAAVSRAGRLVRHVVTHYIGAIFIILIALGGVFYISTLYLGGAGKAWTDIAGIAGSLGITARGVASRIGKLAEEGAQPIYALETTEAKAWEITSLPPVRVTPRASLRLRQAGIRPSRGLSAA